MFDYRLFFPSNTLDERAAPRRPIAGHDARRRVYRIAAERRDERLDPGSEGRR